jgi:multicomponent Na+:H+ antiporter subunit D
MLPTIIALAISTVLNAIYFLRLVITLYSKSPAESQTAIGQEENAEMSGNAGQKSSWKLRVAIICFIGLNFILGMASQPIVRAITAGLGMFD